MEIKQYVKNRVTTAHDMPEEINTFQVTCGEHQRESVNTQAAARLGSRS